MQVAALQRHRHRLIVGSPLLLALTALSPVRGLRAGADWKRRQDKDEWVKKAAQAGYRSRAAFKLLQLDSMQKRGPLLKRGGCALELGSAPGSWTQVMVDKGMHVVGCDLLPMEPVPGSIFVQGDFTEPRVQKQLLDAMEGRQADLIASDMSPNRSGQKSLDQARIVSLVELAVHVAQRCLRPSGSLVAKLLQGADQQAFANELKGSFATVQVVKPKASRKGSAELFVVARGFRPASERAGSSEAAAMPAADSEWQPP